MFTDTATKDFIPESEPGATWGTLQELPHLTDPKPGPGASSAHTPSPRRSPTC